MTITVARDPRTHEIIITGPEGFTSSLEDGIIVQQQLLRVQRLLNEVYRAGYKAGMWSETAAAIAQGEPYDDPFTEPEPAAVSMGSGK